MHGLLKPTNCTLYGNLDLSRSTFISFIPCSLCVTTQDCVDDNLTTASARPFSVPSFSETGHRLRPPRP